MLGLAALLALASTSSAFAGGDNGYSERLVQAESAYAEGRHDEAIELTKVHLRTDNLPIVERVQAYRIQGLAYVAKGEEKNARRAVSELIMLYPEYKPAADAPPAFASMVEEARSRYASGTLRKQDGGNKMQLFYTTAAVAMSALVLGLSSQDW